MRRIIQLTIQDPATLQFETKEQQNAFYQALGYSITWGIASHENHDDRETIQLVNTYIDRNLEITSAFYEGQTLVYDAPYSEKAKFYAADSALNALKTEHHPFDLTGIPENNGTEYEFHS